MVATTSSQQTGSTLQLGAARPSLAPTQPTHKPAQATHKPAQPTHEPVLLDRCVELLAPALQHPGAVLVDGTLGLGGHAGAVLAHCPQAQVIGIDRDPEALAIATQRLAKFGSRFHPVPAAFGDLASVIPQTVAAVLLDLGLSSLQIDTTSRGFSYAQDAPLDMRMDPSLELSAAQVLNTYPEAELTRVLRELGEERYAARIARAVVRRRTTKAWTNSGELVELVRAVVPIPAHRGNPAKRTFQALRIEVNDELGQLRRGLEAAIAALAVGGRLVVLSYHSLEDRIVKQRFAQDTDSRTPLGLPVELDQAQPYLRALTRGAERASDAEVARNPRAASVRLRAVERIRAKGGTE